MVKADAKRNYYADLEISPSADTDEIKKQYRKLARLYHPDRNPGKEVEYVPKFQAIQAAHEILGDPDQRAKYDADRRKLGYGPGSARPPPPPRAGQTNYGRSPYEAWSNFPPPRMRTQDRQPPQPRPQSYHANSSGPPPPRPPTSANYVPPRGPPPRPPPRQSYAKDDAEARKNVFSAWERMKHGGPPPEGWSDDDGLRKARAAKDAAAAHQSKPGLGRSNTTKVPRKAGFDPSDPSARLSGGWEPQARSTSAYSSSHRQNEAPPPAPEPPPPTAHGETPKAKADPLGAFRSKYGDDDPPFSEGLRVRTPYASQGVGQKTYFNPENLSRSASMRDAPGLARDAERKASGRANAGRHRSASPTNRSSEQKPSARRASAQPRGTKQQPWRLDGYTSSSDDGSSEDDNPQSPRSDASTRPMSGSGVNDPRRRTKAQPSSFWNSRRGDPPFNEQTNGTQTAPESPLGGNPPMYGNFTFQPRFMSHLSDAVEVNDTVPKGKMESPNHENLYARRRGSAAGFTPINVRTHVPRYDFHTRKYVVGGRKIHPRKSGTKKQQPILTGSSYSQYTLSAQEMANNPANRFNSFSNVQNGSAPAAGRSNSADNINTKFSEDDWAGKFTGTEFVPNGSSTTRRAAHRRGSPTRRPGRAARSGVSADNPIDLTGSQPGAQGNPIDLNGTTFNVPPPPSHPPPSTGITPTTAGSSGGVPLDQASQSQGPSFSAEQWANTFRDQTFFYQPSEQGRATSPTKPPVPGKKPKAARTRAMSKGDNKFRPPQVVISDASDEEVPMTKTRSAPSGNDGDAMDIDPTPPHSASKPTSPTMSRAPRMVSVPTHTFGRSIDPSTPGAVPSVNGTIPAGHVPTAVPNAAVPPPPPPPPPPTGTVSNTHKKRDTSGSFNVDSLRAAAPFGPSGTGLSGMKSDLSGTLPFESQSSTSRGNAPRQLELPNPPRAPVAPIDKRMTSLQWREYISAMSFYMHAWSEFDGRMLAHFNTRHARLAKFHSGTKVIELLEALGESASAIKGDDEEEEAAGYADYLRWMDEDVRVQKHWDVARERHRYAVEQLLEVKERVRTGSCLIVG